MKKATTLFAVLLSSAGLAGPAASARTTSAAETTSFAALQSPVASPASLRQSFLAFIAAMGTARKPVALYLPTAKSALAKLSQGHPCSSNDSADFATMAAKYQALATAIRTLPQARHFPTSAYIEGSLKYALAWQYAAKNCRTPANLTAKLPMMMGFAKQLMDYWRVFIQSTATELHVSLPAWTARLEG